MRHDMRAASRGTAALASVALFAWASASVLAGAVAETCFAQVAAPPGTTDPGRRAPAPANAAAVLDPVRSPETSFTARQMEIGTALDLLLKDRGVAVVLEPGLRDTVNLRIDHARVGEILGLLSRLHGISYEPDGDVLLVRSQETRVFELDLLRDEIDDALTAGLSSGGSGGDPGSSGGSSGESGVSDWAEIRASLDAMKSEGGLVSIHERAGIVTVRDDPRIVALMQAYLDGVTRRLAHQVQLEARIIEVRLENSIEAGVDWTVMEKVLSGDLEGALSGGDVSTVRTSTGDGVFKLGILNPGRVEAVLDAIAQSGDVRVVARPRVLTSSNRPARFQVTERVPYITKTVTREGGVAYTDFEIEFEDAGVQMEAMAQPTAAGRVALRVHPIVSAVTGYTPSLPDLGPQPIIDVRETTTNLEVDDGQTVVISGLIQDRKIRSTRGIPVLMRIPILGWLFRYTSVATDRVELLILLTPTVVKPATAAAILQGDRQRLIELDGMDIIEPEIAR